jgi:hypothetical protein
MAVPKWRGRCRVSHHDFERQWGGWKLTDVEVKQRWWNELQWSRGWGTVEAIFGAKRNRWRGGLLTAPFIGTTV